MQPKVQVSEAWGGGLGEKGRCMASKLLVSGARRFFARVCPKKPPAVMEQERRTGLEELAIDVNSTGVADVCGTSSVNKGNSRLLESKQLLNQHKFVRLCLPAKDDSGRHQEFRTTSNINKSESSEAHGASHPAVTTKIGGPENGFTSLRSRGRSAIYRMARTPYSRFNHVTNQKVSGSKSYGDSRLVLASGSPSGNGGQVAPKPMGLKRKSTGLDDEIGKICRIKRMRQKQNLLTQGKSIAGEGLGADFTRSASRYVMSNADTRGASSSSASYAHVPRRSTEMATKILAQLEKMPGKEKSLDHKLALAREGSTSKLTPDILHRQALRRMEHLNASKLLQDSQKDQKLVDQPVSRLPEFHEYTKKQGNAEEHSPVKPVLLGDSLKLDRVVQGSDNSSLGYCATPSSSTQPPEKKRKFQMVAPEEWIEMDEAHCNEHGHCS